MSINKNELFNIKTVNELFKSKKIWWQNVITPKKHAFKKVGIWGIIFLFGTAAFISGFSVNSYAASSSTVLPISRGGTNANTAAQAITNLGKVDALSASSTNNQFPSAKAVYDQLLIAKGQRNLYQLNIHEDVGDNDEIIVFGSVADENTPAATSVGTVFDGNIYFFRCLAGNYKCPSFYLNILLQFDLTNAPGFGNPLYNKTHTTMRLNSGSYTSIDAISNFYLGTFLYNENHYVGLRIKDFVANRNEGGNVNLEGFFQTIGPCTVTCPGSRIFFSNVTDWEELNRLERT
ncbi:MAG: hypothetical protein LBT91_01820 [Bifidobacteriaceae bacterium]|jgi:hypothetical protein|nr:hypothetical protein [Bifidobacteriaceae bacterium]